MDSYITEMAAILDSLFLGMVNTTSSAIVVEGGVVRSHEVASSSGFKNYTLQMVSTEVLLCSWLSRYDIKSTISELCGDLQQVDCQNYLKTTRALVHIRQAQGRHISESILFNIWQ